MRGKARHVTAGAIAALACVASVAGCSTAQASCVVQHDVAIVTLGVSQDNSGPSVTVTSFQVIIHFSGRDQRITDDHAYHVSGDSSKVTLVSFPARGAVSCDVTDVISHQG